jgi:dTDP-4-amino-4,6-dideoxygalactose transaminase
VKPGDVVALPGLTFWATYEAVVLVGARPLLIDCDPYDFQMSPGALHLAHERHAFRFAILVHLFGWASAYTSSIRAVCRSAGIALLEDAAQAFGVVVNRGAAPLLTGSTVATLSFYPAKALGGCMDGGAVTCASAEHAATLRSLRNHGRPAAGGYLHERVGMNSRMSALNVAYLLRALSMADRILEDRRRTLARYGELLDGKNGLRVHQPPPGVVGNGYLAVVTSERRDGAALAAALQARGVGYARTYPATIADQAPAREALWWGDLRNARWFCRGVVNPPLFYGIRDDEIERAAAALLEGA